MFDTSLLENMLKEGTAISADGDTEISAYVARRRIFRLANNGITQSTDSADYKLWLRTAKGNKQGAVTLPSLSLPAIREGYFAAKKFRDSAKGSEFDIPFAEQPKETPTLSKTYFESINSLTPHEMTNRLKVVFDDAKHSKVSLAGLYVVSEMAFGVANTRGLFRIFTASNVAFKSVVYADNGSSGYSADAHRDPELVDIIQTSREAISQCVEGGAPKAIPPGKYDIVLLPAAIGDLLEWMAFTAFNSNSVTEDTGFLAGNEGKKVMGDNITIYDNGNEDTKDAFVTPFDFEGVSKKRVDFVKKGIAGKPVYSLTSAHRCGCQTTGHAGPPGSSEVDDMPGNIYIEGGKTTVLDMIKNIDRGIFLPRFHYVNGYLDPKRALMTGLTREGARLIEKGKLSHSVTQLRFTESIVSAFNRTEMLSSDRRSANGDYSPLSSIIVPAMLIREFNFSGASKDVE